MEQSRSSNGFLFIVGVILLAGFAVVFIGSFSEAHVLTPGELADIPLTHHAKWTHSTETWNPATVIDFISRENCTPILVYVCTPSGGHVIGPQGQITSVEPVVIKMLCPVKKESTWKTNDPWIGAIINFGKSNADEDAKVATGYIAGWKDYWEMSLARDHCTLAAGTP